jgi:hypothetical protein
MIDRDRYRDPIVTEEIDGIVYTSTKLPATKALSLHARVARVLGDEGLHALVVSGLGARQVPPAVYLTAVQRILERLGDDVALPRDLCAELKANALRPTGEGRVQPVFDRHFAGEMPHMFEVCLFILRHNILGFTLGSLSLGGSHTSAATDEGTPSNSATPSEGSTP